MPGVAQCAPMPERESPPPPSDGSVTLLLLQLADGEEAALNELIPMIYAELRRIASGQRRRRGSSATLDTTALIHEAYLRFAKRDSHLYSNRQHFFAVAARAMRQILLDEARSRLRDKRGGGAQPESLDAEALKTEEQAELMIALDRGLEKLGRLDERAKKVVEFRYFGGFTENETADHLGVDSRTVRRDWAKARAWLAVELGLADDPLVTGPAP